MSSQGNGGRYSKFQQRLRNIRLSRSKQKKFLDENDLYVQEKVKEIRKVIAKEPARVVRRRVGIGDEIESVKDNRDDKVLVVVEEKKILVDVDKDNKNLKDVDNDFRYEKEFSDDKKDINDVSSRDFVSKTQEIREKKPNFTSIRKGYSYNEIGLKKDDIKNNSNDEKRELLKNLGTEIILKIKEQFEEQLDELEVLMSELYFLKKDQVNELELRKVKEIKKEINQLIDKINCIIEHSEIKEKQRV